MTLEQDTAEKAEPQLCRHLFQETIPGVILPDVQCKGDPWVVLLSTSGFQPTQLNAMDHFTPVWIQDSLPKGAVAKIYVQMQEHIKSLLEVLKTISKQPNGAAAMAVKKTVDDSLSQARGFLKAQDWLKQSDLAAANVPGDGDCAAWTLLFLMKQDPFMPTADADVQQACMEVRKTLASYWLQVSEDKVWQELFQQALIPEPGKSPAVKRELGPVKKEEKSYETPVKKRKPGPPVFIDLMTPPKRVLPTVGEQAGALPTQRFVPELEISAAGKQPDEVSGFSKRTDSKQVSAQRKREAFKKTLDGLFAEEPDNETSRKKKRKNKKDAKKDTNKNAKEDDGGECQEDDCDDDQVDEKQEEASKKKRRRTCKAKERTDDDRRRSAVKAYLGSLQITWAFCQRYHRRMGLPNSQKCQQFNALQNTLLQQQEPSCSTCLAMLKSQGFEMEVLQDCLANSLDRELFPDTPGISQLRKMNQDMSRFLNDPEDTTVPIATEEDPLPAQDVGEPEALQLVALPDPAAEGEDNPENEEERKVHIISTHSVLQ